MPTVFWAWIFHSFESLILPENSKYLSLSIFICWHWFLTSQYCLSSLGSFWEILLWFLGTWSHLHFPQNRNFPENQCNPIKMLPQRGFFWHIKILRNFFWNNHYAKHVAAILKCYHPQMMHVVALESAANVPHCLLSSRERRRRIQEFSSHNDKNCHSFACFEVPITNQSHRIIGNSGTGVERIMQRIWDMIVTKQFREKKLLIV